MNRNIYKLKLWADVGEGSQFIDCYLDLNKITGFYIPGVNEEGRADAINLLYEGDIMTVLQQKHIIDYLTNEFVNKSIEPS